MLLRARIFYSLASFSYNKKKFVKIIKRIIYKSINKNNKKGIKKIIEKLFSSVHYYQTCFYDQLQVIFRIYVFIFVFYFSLLLKADVHNVHFHSSEIFFYHPPPPKRIIRKRFTVIEHSMLIEHVWKLLDFSIFGFEIFTRVIDVYHTKKSRPTLMQKKNKINK